MINPNIIDEITKFGIEASNRNFKLLLNSMGSMTIGSSNTN